MQGPKWPVLLIIIVYETLCGHWCCLGQVLYLGRAPHTKETLPDFLKWRLVTRHPLVFRGLTGSQWTPGFGESQFQIFLSHLVYTIAHIYE